MFHIYTIFHQMFSLDVTILKWEYYIFHAYTMWHYVVTCGFDDILSKCNREAVLIVAGNCQPCHNFFFLIYLFLIFFINFRILLIPFFYFNLKVILEALLLKIFLLLRILLEPYFLIVYFNSRIFLYLHFWYACYISEFSWYFAFRYIIFDVQFSRYFPLLYCFVDSFLLLCLFLDASLFLSGSLWYFHF